MDDREATGALRAVSKDGVVYRVVVGTDELISAASPDLCALLDVDAAELLGTSPVSMESWFVRRFGQVVEKVRLADDNDRVELEVRLENATIRTVLVPERDQRGTADRVHLLFALV